MRRFMMWGVWGVLGSLMAVGCGVTQAEIDPIVKVYRTDGELRLVLTNGEKIEIASGTNVTLQVNLDRDVSQSDCVWSSLYSDQPQSGFEYNETFEREGSFQVTLWVDGQSRSKFLVIVSGSNGTVIDDPSFQIISDGFIILGETGEIVDLLSRQVAIVFGKVLVLDGGGMVTGGRKPYNCRWEDEWGVPFWWQFKLDCNQSACSWLLSCCDSRKIFLVIMDARGQVLRCPFIIIPPPAAPPATQAPSVWLKANGQTDSSSINAGQNGSAVVRLEWGSERATTLVASSNLQSKEFDGPVALSGVKDLILSVGTYIFRVDGVGPGGAKGASVAVTVNPYQPPATQPSGGDENAPVIGITWPDTSDGHNVFTLTGNPPRAYTTVKVEVFWAAADAGQLFYRIQFPDQVVNEQYANGWVHEFPHTFTKDSQKFMDIVAQVTDSKGRKSNQAKMPIWVKNQ